MGKILRRILSVLMASLLVAVIFSGCLGGENIITAPAGELIVDEDDFDNNWTSWWVILPVESNPFTGGDSACTWVKHYTEYPIREDSLDLVVFIDLWIYDTVENATLWFESQINQTSSANWTEYDIGDQGFYLRGTAEDRVLFNFRVSNACIFMQFWIPGMEELDPFDQRIVNLLALQGSKLT